MHTIYCDKTIPIIEHENLHTYFKTRAMSGIYG
jgi:hypothetical protein